MSESDLSVVVWAEDDRLTLGVRGEIDVASAAVLRSSLEKAASEGQPVVVVDLSEVTFLDSSGVGVLASAYQRLQGGGRQLILRSPQDAVRRVLGLAGIDLALEIE